MKKKRTRKKAREEEEQEEEEEEGLIQLTFRCSMAFCSSWAAC